MDIILFTLLMPSTWSCLSTFFFSTSRKFCNRQIHNYSWRFKYSSFQPQFRKIPWRKAWKPTPVFLPEETHGQRSLVGYSPQDHKVSDTTEATYHTHTHSHTIYVLWLYWIKLKINNINISGKAPQIWKSSLSLPFFMCQRRNQ